MALLHPQFQPSLPWSHSFVNPPPQQHHTITPSSMYSHCLKPPHSCYLLVKLVTALLLETIQDNLLIISLHADTPIVNSAMLSHTKTHTFNIT